MLPAKRLCTCAPGGKHASILPTPQLSAVGTWVSCSSSLFWELLCADTGGDFDWPVVEGNDETGQHPRTRLMRKVVLHAQATLAKTLARLQGLLNLGQLAPKSFLALLLSIALAEPRGQSLPQADASALLASGPALSLLDTLALPEEGPDM